ncbi:MAG: DNA polymerase III subunit gamma/tau [Campylobacterales bacterium]|nr:DNA polymerase III subunit gamma/tau [Campylobacterales bacterium]
MKPSSEVLARKYRPKNFDELIGQETIAQTLSLALDSDRLSHAYLFSGLRGSGKTSTARIFAKALICEKGVSHNPCGVCENCIMAIQNRHMDIVEMDAASSRKIDDIRDLIEQTKYRPAVARYKIFIIDEVHMLTKEAFNALLKTLEEPPSYVKFILATTDPLKLPATILSRTQHFRFKSIATHKIISHLSNILHKEQIEYEPNALEILARSGNGSLRDTLTLLDQAIIYSKNHVDVKTVTDMLGLVDPKFISDIFQTVFEKNHLKLIEYTKQLEDYEPDMVIDELIAHLKERMYNRDPHFSTLILERFFRILSDSKSLLSINADGSFVLSLVFFKMVEALKVKEIDQMIESLQKGIDFQNIAPMQVKQKEYETKNIEDDIPQEVKDSTKPEIKKDDNRFQTLIDKIKDRSYELGVVFEQSVKFISYENSVLTWESCADDNGKTALKHGYSAIKQLVREIYGFETQIKGVACQSKPTEMPKPEIKTEPIIEQKPIIESNPASMVEDIEIGGAASCVGGCSQSDEGSKEIDGEDIKNEPMVQKAIELFEATKITIQSKI